MNIVQILPALGSGGVETGTVDLAKELIARGHRAVVISAGGRLVAELESAGAKHYTLPVDRKQPWSILGLVPKVARILRDEEADIIHARSRVPGWIAYIASRLAAVKFVTTCHGWYRSKGTSSVMGWGARVIVASNSIGRHMHDDFDVPFENIRLIPRGVDLSQFSFRGARRVLKGGGPVIGLVGRITTLKGHEVLIRAAAPLARKFPGLQVKIVGTAPKGKEKYKNHLELLVDQLGLKSVVKFLGDRSDIPRILKGLDLLVIPTVTPEAFGRVAIEAQAIGVPVIATRVGGLAEVVDNGRTGFLVGPRDPDGLRRKIEEVLSEPAKLSKTIEEARRKVESEYSLKLMVDRTINLYEEVVAEKRILLIKLGALGDVILATPSIRMLRIKFPDAHITLLTDPAYAALAGASPYLNNILTFDRKRAGTSLRELFRFSDQVRKQHFDISVDLQSSTFSYLAAFTGGVPHRYGYRRKFLGRLLNRGIEGFKTRMAPVEHQFQVLKCLGVSQLDAQLELWTTPEDIRFVDRFLSEEWMPENPILIGMHVGASGRWESKRWPMEYFARLGDSLAGRLGGRVILTGGREEIPEARRLAALMKVKPIIAVGKTELTELVELIRRCHAFVCGDSAPLHMAATVRTPVVALFGPTDPMRHMPPGKGHRVLYTKISCSPCYRPVCPKGHHRCLRDIHPEAVLAEVEAQVAEARRRRSPAEGSS